MRFENQPNSNNPETSIEDYSDAPFYNLLERLPQELALFHLNKIIEQDLDDNSAIEYLSEIINLRREAVTSTVISDDQARELFAGHEKELFRELETTIFNQTDNILGAGTTARVKRFDLSGEEISLPMAIKYVISPNASTLSASEEHNMVREVERMQAIEDIEKDVSFEYLGVPHPYFHHTTSNMQFYGMQLIDGPDLDFDAQAISEYELPDELLEKLEVIDTEKLSTEIDMFFEKMHTYCLHGDIKPKNIMIDNSGKFYFIDFGQSVLANTFYEKDRDRFDNLKEAEVAATKEAIKIYIRKSLKKAAKAKSVNT